jgi:hypothetical protein
VGHHACAGVHRAARLCEAVACNRPGVGETGVMTHAHAQMDGRDPRAAILLCSPQQLPQRCTFFLHYFFSFSFFLFFFFPREDSQHDILVQRAGGHGARRGRCGRVPLQLAPQGAHCCFQGQCLKEFGDMRCLWLLLYFFVVPNK